MSRMISLEQFQTPTNQAEELKKKYGCASSSLTNEGEKISTPSINEGLKIFSHQAFSRRN